MFGLQAVEVAVVVELTLVTQVLAMAVRGLGSSEVSDETDVIVERERRVGSVGLARPVADRRCRSVREHRTKTASS